MRKLITIVVLLLLSTNFILAQDKTETFDKYDLKVLQEWVLSYNITEEEYKEIKNQKPSLIGRILSFEIVITDQELKEYYNNNFEVYNHDEIKHVFFIFADKDKKKILENVFNQIKNEKDINNFYNRAKDIINSKYPSLAIEETFWTPGIYDDQNDIVFTQMDKGFRKLSAGEHTNVGVVPNYFAYIIGCLEIFPAVNTPFEEAKSEIITKKLYDYIIDGSFEKLYNKHNVKPDENGFIIEDGVLTSYVGNEQDIEIPMNVTKIAKDAFAKKNKNGEYINSNVQSITCFDGLTTIEDYAFNGLRNLKTIIFPKTLENITGLAFFDCPNLEKINILGNSPNFEVKNGLLYKRSGYIVYCPPAFNNYINNNFERSEYGIGSFANSRLVKWSQGGNTYIPDYLFANSKSLKEVDVDTIYIGAYAFLNCVNLEKCTLNGWSGFKINEGAFSNCINLKEIIFEKNLAEIKKDDFKDCVNLNKVVILNPSDKITFEPGSFDNNKKLTIYTNDSTVFSYAKANNINVEIIEK